MASADMKVKELVSNPETKAILEKHLPGVTSNPLVKMALGMTLKSVASFKQAKQVGLTPEKYAAIVEDLEAMP
jgi:hypothetical protein